MINKKQQDFSIDFEWGKDIEFSCENHTEVLGEDKLNRLPYAEYLYFYLKEQGKEKNTVINLNAEWGAGKTFFVKRLYSSLKNKHPCIYIDAWKQDYSDDAFLTLFSSLITQIEKYAGRLDSRLINIGDALGRFTKGIVPEILSGIAKEYVGIEDMGAISKKAAELLLSEHEKKSKAMQSLRKELSFWAELSFKKGFEAPVFIFIDELDRCRPDYAVSLLEIVKHFFDIEKFVFIIATDTNQLQHSIKNLYGNEFAANDYLGRFFHRRFSLRAPNVELLILARLRERKIDDNFELDLFEVLYPRPASVAQFSNNLSSVFNAFNLNIRDVIRNIDRIIDMFTLGMFKKKIDYLALAMLMVIYDKEYSVIDQILKRDRINKKVDMTISENANLHKFIFSELKLELDTSISHIGIDYYHTRSISNFQYNNLGTETVFVPPLDYLVQFIEFMTAISRSKDRPRTERENEFLDVSSHLTGLDKIRLHIASVYRIESKKEIYGLQSYIDFIEMANSFE